MRIDEAIKDSSIPIIHGKAELELHDKSIRNKAIDDFVKSIRDIVFDYTNEAYIKYNDLLMKAEQLKEK